ncbi:hypothetical protein ACFLT9_04640, partial [Acidobacteriota bacterium]
SRSLSNTKKTSEEYEELSPQFTTEEKIRIILDGLRGEANITDLCRKERIREWVDYYNNHRYPEAIDNVTPVDKYFGRDRRY